VRPTKQAGKKAGSKRKDRVEKCDPLGRGFMGSFLNTNVMHKGGKKIKKLIVFDTLRLARRKSKKTIYKKQCRSE